MAVSFRPRCFGGALAAGLFFAVLSGPAHAQVVAIVNGAPITALDIEQRTKLTKLTTGKAPTRQQILDDLVNDQIKLSVARRYGFEVTSAEIDEAFGNMARNGRVTPEQMAQQLNARGIQTSAMKARIKAEITWNQIIRGKFASSLTIPDSEVSLALRSRNVDDKDEIGYTYTLYPIVYVVPRGSPAPMLDAKRREAEALRSRFQECGEGLRLARALREVAVREPIRRSSADLNQQLRELLSQMQVGQLTAPEMTPQGLQMFALCDKKQTTQDSPAKRQVRDELFNKRYEVEAKKYLEQERRQAMIEYR